MLSAPSGDAGAVGLDGLEQHAAVARVQQRHPAGEQHQLRAHAGPAHRAAVLRGEPRERLQPAQEDLPILAARELRRELAGRHHDRQLGGLAADLAAVLGERRGRHRAKAQRGGAQQLEPAPRRDRPIGSQRHRLAREALLGEQALGMGERRERGVAAALRREADQQRGALFRRAHGERGEAVGHVVRRDAFERG